MSSNKMSIRSKTSTGGVTIDNAEVPEKRKRSGTLTKQVEGEEINLETSRSKRIPKRELLNRPVLIGRAFVR